MITKIFNLKLIVILLISFTLNVYSFEGSEAPDLPINYKRAKLGLEWLTYPGKDRYFKAITYNELLEVVKLANDISRKVENDPIWKYYLTDKYSFRAIKGLLYHPRIQSECTSLLKDVSKSVEDYVRFKKKMHKRIERADKSEIYRLQARMKSLLRAVNQKIRNLENKIDGYRSAVIQNCTAGGFFNKDPRVRLVCIDIVRRVIPNTSVKLTIQGRNLIKVYGNKHMRNAVETVKDDNYYYTNVHGLNHKYIKDKRKVYEEFSKLYDFTLRQYLVRLLESGSDSFMQNDDKLDVYLPIFTSKIENEGYTKLPFNRNRFETERQLKNYIRVYTRGIRNKREDVRNACTEALVLLLRTTDISNKLKAKIMRKLIDNDYTRHLFLMDILNAEELKEVGEYAKDETDAYEYETEKEREKAYNTNFEKIKYEYVREKVKEIISTKYQESIDVINRIIDFYVEKHGYVKPFPLYADDRYDYPDHPEFLPPKFVHEPISYQKVLSTINKIYNFKETGEYEDPEAAKDKKDEKKADEVKEKVDEGEAVFDPKADLEKDWIIEKDIR